MAIPWWPDVLHGAFRMAAPVSLPALGKPYLLVTGMTDDEARNAFVKRYGERPRMLYRDGLRVYVGPVPATVYEGQAK